MCGIAGKGTNSIFLFLLGLVQHPFATHTQEKRIEKDNRADCSPSFAFSMYASTKHEEEIAPLLINIYTVCSRSVVRGVGVGFLLHEIRLNARRRR